jgi:tripartite-type tricarboxylate transporter receptor subunit TctC
MMATHSLSRRTLLQAGVAALASAQCLQAIAQDGGTVRILLGSPPGSALDTLCRVVAEGLQPAYHHSIIVETRGGASGQIAVSAVKAAAADGMTILATPMPQMAIFPHSYRKLPYDSVGDFAAVGMGAKFDLAFAVGPAVPPAVQTIHDFVAWCKANPGRGAFGSPAAGSTPHFVGAMAARAAGIALTHVPYRGPTPAVMDMLGGQIAAACVPVGDVLSYARAGRCRLLATTGPTRSSFVPDVPTFLEQGFKEIVLDDWFGFFVPRKTPAPQVDKLSIAMRATLARPEAIKSLAERGLVPAWSTPAELAARLRADLAKWGPIVKSFGFTAET